MLIALVMFVIITMATSAALRSALKSQQAVQQRADEIQEVRVLFDVFAKDLRAAYASAANYNTYFRGQPNQLNFTTLNNRILMGNQLDNSGNAYGQELPQSDIAAVSYQLPGELDRIVTTVPNPDFADPQATPGDPQQLLSRHVREISFMYLPPPPSSGQSVTSSTPEWQDSWDYYIVPPDGGSGGGTQSGASAGDNTLGGTETTLPQAVKITLSLAGIDGRISTYSTIVTIATPTPQPKGQAPETTTTGTGTGGTGGGGGGGGGGGTGGGGTGGGNLPSLSGTGVRQ